MERLHLVGVNLTRDGLIFSGSNDSRAGSYLVPVDRNLALLVADLIGLPVADGGHVGPDQASEQNDPSESALPVREIQARLRGGRSVEEVAEAAGVQPSWVERFAPPIRAEQQRVIAQARERTLDRARLGASVLPLGRAVARNLAAAGLRLSPKQFDDAWTAYHSLERRWIVEIAYTHRGRDHVATWEIDVGTGDLVASDRRSMDLGHVSDATDGAVDTPERPKSKRPAAPPKRSAAATKRASGSRSEPEAPPVEQPAERVPGPADGAGLFGERPPGRRPPVAAPPAPANGQDEPWADVHAWLVANDDLGATPDDDFASGLLALIDEVTSDQPVEPVPWVSAPPAAGPDRDPDTPAPRPVDPGDGEPFDPEPFDPEAFEPEPFDAAPGDDEPAVDPLAFLGEAIGDATSGQDWDEASEPARIRADRADRTDPHDASGDEPVERGNVPPTGSRDRTRPLRAR